MSAKDLFPKAPREIRTGAEHWVCARTGQIADSFANIAALEQLPDVEKIEPQMLMERHAR